MSIQTHLRRLFEGISLGRDEARPLMNAVLGGRVAEVEMAAMLGALAARGETAEEIAGFVDAMRMAAIPIPLTNAERDSLVDTCGTGGDGANTFNISTAAALVASAAGAKVAKHGNRAVTSSSGSADVLEALSIPVNLSADEAAKALREHGFAYLHAPALQPAMKAVLPVRRALGVRTVFNLMGPLANPAGARAQVMGVYAAGRIAVVAEAMVLLDVRHAFVVHGFVDDKRSTGMDELSISGPSEIAEVRNGVITRHTVIPEDFGFQRASIAAIRGGDASRNAEVLRGVFAGKTGPCRDVVVLNAAAVLITAGLAIDLAEGTTLAQSTIDSGAVLRLLAALA